MTAIRIDIPDEVALALETETDALASQLGMAAAVKLYELGRLSSGAAAQLAGIPKPVFLARLADYNVSTFVLTEEELRRDLADA